MNIKESKELLKSKLKKVKGIIDKNSNKFYLKGENPFMDMQIDNYILCPKEINNWFGFIKNDYELVYY